MASAPEPMYHMNLDLVMTTDDMMKEEMVAHMLASTPKNVGQIQYRKSQELQDEDSTTLARHELQSDDAQEEKEVTEMEDVHSDGDTSNSPSFFSPVICKSMSEEFLLSLRNDSSFPETSYANPRESELPTTLTMGSTHFPEELSLDVPSVSHCTFSGLNPLLEGSDQEEDEVSEVEDDGASIMIGSLALSKNPLFLDNNGWTMADAMWHEIDTNFDEELYHEKQDSQMCLMHALNALFQCQKYTKEDLDAICKQLNPDKLINPHKSLWRTGNYNAEVLMMALFQEDVDVQWFDSRKAQSDLSLNDDFLCPMREYSEFLGFIVNERQKKMMIFDSRHWKTITKIGGVWYDFDSKLSKPKQLGEKELLERLVTACSNGAQIMICRKKREGPKGNFFEIQDGNSPKSAPSMSPGMDESKVEEPEFFDYDI